jgi:hypothetical protein
VDGAPRVVEQENYEPPWLHEAHRFRDVTR